MEFSGLFARGAQTEISARECVEYERISIVRVIDGRMDVDEEFQR